MRIASDFGNIAVLLLLAAMFFAPLLAAGTVLRGGDLPDYLVYSRLRALDNFSAGEWPAWNPAFGLGLPEDMLGRYFSLFYPPNLCWFFLSPDRALGLICFLHLVLAGLFMYLMLRGLFVGPSGAFVGGLVFGLGGYPLARLWNGDLTTLTALVYFPLIFLCGIRAFRGGWRFAGIALVLLFLQAWDGNLAVTLIQLLVLIAEALWVAGEMSSWRPLAVLAVLLAVALPLLAPLWLPPFYQALLPGAAVPAALPASAGAVFSPFLWLTLPWPHLFGALTEFTWWPTEPAAATAGGLGMTATFLVLMGARRTQRGLFFLALVFVFALLAAGDLQRLTGWLGAALAACGLFSPAAAWAGVHFALAALAGMGWERLFWDDGPKRSFFVLRVLGWIALAVPLLLLGLGRIAGEEPLLLARCGAAWFGWALGATVLLLLALAVVRGVNRDRRWGEIIVLLLLLGELTYYNARYLQLWPAGSYLPWGEWREWSGVGGHRAGRLLAADRVALGVPALDGCRFVNAPLLEPAADPLAGALLADTGDVAHPLWAYCSLRGIIATRPLTGGWQARGSLLARGGTGLHFVDRVQVARPPAYLPFAFLTERVRRVAAADLAGALAELDWQAGEVVVTDELPDTVGIAPNEAREDLSELAAGDDMLAWRTTRGAPGLLFISQRWHPDWRATVDGRPATVTRANGMFCIVPVPAGTHEVRLRFFAPARRWSLMLFAAALLATVYLLAARREWRHPLSHSLPRTVQRVLVLVLLTAWVLGLAWPAAVRDFTGAFARPLLTPAAYAAAAQAFAVRGMALPAFNAAYLAARQ